MTQGGQLLQLAHCSIEWTDYGTRVVFPGDKEVSAWPHPDDHHYHALSHRLGYGDNILAYCREHELAHAIAGEEFWRGPSYVLYSLAHDEKMDGDIAGLEELAAMTIQRWVRANELPMLDRDWDALKARFLGYVTQLDAMVWDKAT